MRDGIDEYTLLCEDCGYVIEGLPRDGACPECGKAVAESLPERRDRVPSVWRIFNSPRQSFALLAIESAQVANTRMWLRCMAVGQVLTLAVAIGRSLYMFAYSDFSTALGNLVISVVVAGVAGLLVGVILFVLTLIESLGLRLIGRRRGFRVTREIAETVCSHACAAWMVGSLGWFAGWCLAGLTGVLATLGFVGPVENWLGYGGLGLAAFSAVAGFLLFETYAYIGMRGCRFANRHRPDPGSRSNAIDAVECVEETEARR